MSRPWMPLYVADYRNDTAHLDVAESGAYLHLIMHYWSFGSLPDDDAKLARIAKMSARQWRQKKPTIQAFFHDGWQHKRIDAELARAADISSKRSASAKLKHSNSSANAPANAEQLDTHARASSQPQSQIQREESLEARKRATRLQKDWWPSEANIQYALAKHLSLDRVSVEAEKFRNHWIAKAGRDATKLDWNATWENWILKAVEIGNGHSKPFAKPSLVEIGQQLADEARELERAAGIGRSDDPVRSH